jgi:hypothetical protein
LNFPNFLIWYRCRHPFSSVRTVHGYLYPDVGADAGLPADPDARVHAAEAISAGHAAAARFFNAIFSIGCR